MKLAIQPDSNRYSDGTYQSYSDRWFFLAEERGITPVEVNVHSSDVLEAIGF